MKLNRVISGGQTGADITGLECAEELGLETGGFVPRGCRTEDGANKRLVTQYGCIETATDDYKTRTRANAAAANATVWFGNLGSPGWKCTRQACKDYLKPFFENPSELEFINLCDLYEIINVAGNRASTNPSVVDLVRLSFRVLIGPTGLTLKA